MPSFRCWVAAAAVAAFSITAHADYVIDPDSVPIGTREVWCEQEKQTCPLICQQTQPQTTLVNECNPDTLTYGCLCGNNKRPNISEYTLTLPYFVCQEWGTQCVTGCNGDNTCASACRQDHPCGASNPERFTKTKTATTAAATASQTDDSLTTVYTGTPGDDSDDDDGDDSSSSSSSSSDKPGAAAALEIGRAYGLAIVLGGLFAGFALL